MTAPSAHPSPLTLVAHDPVDLFALVPVVLGFEPTESLVLLTFGATHPFHARIDLPTVPDRTLDAEVVDALLEPALRHRVARVVLVGYSADRRRAGRVVGAARRAFARAGVDVLAGLCADGRRWWPVPAPAGFPGHGAPYDLGGHRFAAEAVLDGRVVHGSREELRATLAADPVRVGRVVAALAGLGGDPPVPSVDEAWVRELLRTHLAGAEPPGDEAVARLLRGLLDIPVRDAAWAEIRRAEVREHLAFWTDLVRRAPDPLVPAPASLLAFAAWQAGHGALAWCAVERAQEADPDYHLADLVAQVLEQAIPPDAWEGMGGTEEG
ncbi:DUF4192 domain-containing protein [Nocardioides mangrovi]|uniref:DUF4192 domain-containing protein n=1 Tax=Nocardioides mangrovi TaxID=2874580 RepID=A0ABS7U7I2_9ACTN|nr:DUF4192 domain-containing protein [Nocardioides mangrovi]MBZ5736944.1 DUF4192 domain-containing protein [Nocardioides mangrovi]